MSPMSPSARTMLSASAHTIPTTAPQAAATSCVKVAGMGAYAAHWMGNAHSTWAFSRPAHVVTL